MATKKRLNEANAVDYENIMCSQSQLHWLNAIIEKQPTVDAVEVVHWRWKKIPYHPYCCSKCNETAPLDQSGEFYYTSNYCPNCGAKMDGVSDG